MNPQMAGDQENMRGLLPFKAWREIDENDIMLCCLYLRSHDVSGFTDPALQDIQRWLCVAGVVKRQSEGGTEHGEYITQKNKG